MSYKITTCLIFRNHSHKPDIFKNFIHLRILAISLSSWRLHCSHYLFKISQISKKCFKTRKWRNNSLLLSANFLLLFFKFFEHARIKLILFLWWLCHSPFLFLQHWLNCNLRLIMIFQIKFNFSVRCF
jgi:hypothetical protein